MQLFEIFKINESADKIYLPRVEGFSAGFPMPSADYTGDTIDLNDILITSPGNTFYARVKGYYPIVDELERGDAVIFDRALTPRKGDLAMCVVDGEAQLKYIEGRRGAFCLVAGATNDTVQPDGEGSSFVMGIVTSIIKVRRNKGRRTKGEHTVKRKPVKESEKRAIRWGYAPEDETDTHGFVNLNDELVKNPVFTLFGKAVGVSLIEDGIQDGDNVIIDRILDPIEGDLVVSYTDAEFTMKYVVVKDDGIWLMPGNRNYEPIHITEDNDKLIWGVVVSSIKQLRFRERKK